jgi:hypothetical protein
MSKTSLPSHDNADGVSAIRLNDASPPVQIPPGHVGPVVLPGTGRMVWWTGRVAIGLRHQPVRSYGPLTQSALWIQSALLRRTGGKLAGA